MERYNMLNRLEELILLESSYTQTNIQIQQNPYQNSNSIFHRNRTTLNFAQIHRRPQIAKAILRKKNKTRDIIPLIADNITNL